MTLDSLIKNIKWRFGRLFYSKSRQLWQKAVFANEDFKNGKYLELSEYSTETADKGKCKKRAICIYDGKIKSGGLADRLRGIVSVYEICKELDLEFKLVFTSPFKLQQFLEPNKVDWPINKEELNYNTNITDVCYIDTLTGSDYEAAKQKEWFTKEFKKRYKEFHVRTNALFSYKGNYSTLFHELFKFSPKLQSSIDKQKEIIGGEYISTSFRFMNLLGDFNETTGIRDTLSDEERALLIKRNIAQLENLHTRFPNKRILINSDSTTFLQKASKLGYAYIIPGNITHIDAESKNNEYYAYEKTFLDFFMIANAEKIFVMRTGNMYNSGYPYAASLIYNKPFERIEF